MPFFRGNRLERIDLEIASFGNGEAAKIDRCVRIGPLAIITGWSTAEPDIAIPGTFFSRHYRRADVEREVGPAGKGFIRACHLPNAQDRFDLLIRVGRKRYRCRIPISDDPAIIETLGREQQDQLPALHQSAHQILPEAAEALGRVFAWALQSPGEAATSPATAEDAALDMDRPTPEPESTRQPLSVATGAIDEVIQVGDRGYFVIGWCITADAARTRLLLSTGTGEGHDLLAGAYRVARPDLLEAIGPAIRAQSAQAGFLRYIEDDAIQQPGELAASLELAGTLIGRLAVPLVQRFDDPIETTESLLKHLHPGSEAMLALLDQQLGPALSQVPFRCSHQTEAELIRFFDGPAEPWVSLIVPIYGRYDFIEYQLSQFANDPDFRQGIELLYVLDDPALADGFTAYCAEVAPLYEVPFATVLSKAHLGFAGANNLGARFARGERLLLLNSDVIPSQGGWLSALRERFDLLPEIGALGVRLLYPDEALQHDGMAFKRLPALGNLWINDHPGKGLPAMPVAAEGALVEVQASTAACLMLRKADFLAVGGFDEGYIIGDFEDSDLCLALQERGLRTYVARDLVLYHLERQSQRLFADPSWREKITVYNCWRHSRKWQAQIERISAGALH
jgi:GT2 family glycosyltransferase